MLLSAEEVGVAAGLVLSGGPVEFEDLGVVGREGCKVLGIVRFKNNLTYLVLMDSS